MSEEQPLGTILKQRRQELDLSLADLARLTRIRPSQLEALEEGHYETLPGEAYRTGFLRLYAGAVGLDPGEVLERYRREEKVQAAAGPLITSRAVEFPAERTALSRPRLWPLALLTALAVAALVYFFLEGGMERLEKALSTAPVPTTAPADEAPPPVGVPEEAPPAPSAAVEPGTQTPELQPSAVEPLPLPAVPAPAGETIMLPPAGAQLRLQALDDCSVTVAVDGQAARRYDLPRSAALRWTVKERMTLAVDDPACIRVWVGEDPVPLAGRKEVVFTSAPESELGGHE